MVAFWGCPAGLPCGPRDRRLPSERRTRCCRIDTPRPVRVTAIVAQESDERGAAGSTRGRTEVGRWPQRRSGTAPPVWGRGRWPPRAALTARRRPPQQDERAAGIARRPSCVARPALLAVRTTAAAPRSARSCASARLRWGGRRPPGSRIRRCNPWPRSEEHTSELQSREKLVCRLLL